MLNTTRHAVPQSRLADLLRQAEAALHGLSQALWPVLDLLIRIGIAQAFFVSGLLKAGNWENALMLARDEYPVPWMDPVTAAWTGVSIELVASVLLVAGLATRPAALALLLLTLVTQIYYVALDTHLFWIFSLMAFVVRGAGPLSLDAAVGPGLRTAPIPFARQTGELLSLIVRYFGPVYPALLRVWLGSALLLAASHASPAAWPMFPVFSLSILHAATALTIGCMLIAGLGTRIAALGLLLLVTEAGMAGTAVIHLAWLLPQLVFLALRGGGPAALDTLLRRLLLRIVPGLAESTPEAIASLPRVVIVGAGFAGIACARGLRHAPVQVILIDRKNYHLFQPLLYQVATAGLSPSDIATPVREIFREQRNLTVLLGAASAVDSAGKTLTVEGQTISYDYLVLATGASHSYFGRDEWAPYAPGLKCIEDAADIRRRVLLAFEHAEACDDPVERNALMTFLIVGGGPTGVEMAGAIAELARHGMEQDFRRIDPTQARVILVQSAPRLLPTFPEALSTSAARSLERLGVVVRTGSRVTHIDAAGADVDAEHIPARTVIWAAGVVASPAARWVGAAADRAGRVEVDAGLAVPGHAGVYAIGDTALSNAWAGQPVPGLAPAAKQGGEYVARVIRNLLLGNKAPPPFVYQHLGSLATIGRQSAVADFGFIRLSGAPAWWLWGLVHVFFLVGMRNRVSVIWDWIWAYLTFRSSTRLITG